MSGIVATAMPAEQLTLAQLPDDVLLVVMQLLYKADLFALRLVCKRLGGLALHPDVWRHRLLVYPRLNTCRCAVLRLAPCVDLFRYGDPSHISALMTTTCAVRHLDMVTEDTDYCYAATALVIRNQQALGRLRSVKLLPWHPWENVEPRVSVDVLLKTLVAGSSGLESLDLPEGFPRPHDMLPLRGPPRSSLKYFKCALAKNAENSLNTVLAGHAATLEEVDFDFSDCSLSADTAAVLARMPRLRKLNCRVFPGIEVLAACKMLSNVSLGLWQEEGAIEGAVAFFRQADQLRVVYVCYDSVCYCDLKDLSGALASSGRSLVERLTFHAFKGDVQPLLPALPRLPALRVLSFLRSPLFRAHEVDKMDELLLGLTPASAPALRLLKLSQDMQLGGTKGCVHNWLHRGSVKKALAANPLLHILVLGPDVCHLSDSESSDDEDCDVCPLDCHSEFPNYFHGELGLFSHNPDKCPSPEEHTINEFSVWMHINCNSE